MPRIKSAKKRLRQSRTREAHNRDQRSALRTALKKVRGAASKKDAADAFPAAERLLDRAARHGIVHRNAAARQKSRLKKLISSKS
ncbi:MAG TPA: 30S ribosomal protein S20 [Gemmatimonadales bacterium]